MGRKKVTEGGTKEKIIIAALKLFSQRGYEETSVRMILEEADAVVGTFYHYFSSKEELFEETIAYFLLKHTKRISMIANDNSKTVTEALTMILNEVEQQSKNYYNKLQANRLHWTMEYALHMRTVQSILPDIENMLSRALSDGTVKNVMNLDISTLAAILLNGVEGILHAKPMETLNSDEMNQVKHKVIAFVSFLLGVKAKPD